MNLISNPNNILIAGVIGSGKTVVINLLVEEATSKGFSVTVIDDDVQKLRELHRYLSETRDANSILIASMQSVRRIDIGLAKQFPNKIVLRCLVPDEAIVLAEMIGVAPTQVLGLPDLTAYYSQDGELAPTRVAFDWRRPKSSLIFAKQAKRN